MPEIQNAPQVHGISLGHDFGQSSVGKLGGRTVQQVAPEPPRTIGQALSSFFSDIKSLGTRLLDMVTPHGVRSEGKFRRGLEEVSAKMGDLLGALSKTKDHPVDGTTARKIIDRMAGVAEPVLSRGVEYPDLARERISLHVRNMTPGQLTALRDGVALAQPDAQDDEVLSSHLELIARTVQVELTSRLREGAMEQMRPILELAIAQVAREGDHPGAVDYSYRSLHGLAGKLLGELGIPDQPGDMRRALIKDTISRLVDNEVLPMGDVGRMILALPSSEMRDLVKAHGKIGGEDPFTCERLVMGAIGLRAQNSEAGFEESARKLLGGEGDLVKNLIDGGRALEDLRRHSGANSLHIGEKVDETLARLHAQLEETLSPARLELGKLDDTTLFQLSKSIQSLGVERPVAGIDAEIARRKTEARDAFSTVLKGAIALGTQGDLGGMLRGLVEAKESGSKALETMQKLGEKIDDTDKIMAFRESLTLGALRSLPQGDLMTLFGALNGLDGKSLSGALIDATYELMPTGRNPGAQNEDLAKQLFDVANDLTILDMGVKQVLEQQGLSLPPLPDQKEYGVSDLTPKAREALEQAFGLSVSETNTINVRIGVAGPGFSGAFQKNLDEMGQGIGDEKLLNGGERTGVDKGLWLDMGRANYSVKLDGVSHPMLDREGFNGLDERGQTERRLAGVEQLRALVGGDEELLMLVSRYANQNTLAGIQAGLLSDASPVRLPDGTPGRLNGHEHITYNFSSDGNGGMRIRMDYSVSEATHFFNPDDGSMTPLDPEGSRCHFSLELTVGKDRSVTVSDPIQYYFDLKTAPT